MQTDLPEVKGTVCDAVLEAEELEIVVAPKLGANHNETFVSAPGALEAEELEAVIAPKLAANHNETFIRIPMQREPQARQ